MIVRIPLPAYTPDQFNNSGVLLRAENVYPAMDGYRAVGGVTTFSDALSGTFMGGYSAVSNDGTAYLLAGTGSNLYRLTSAGAWTSLVGSLSITARWRFAQFKNYVITVNQSTTRVVDLGAGTAASLAGAPTGNCIGVVGDHVVIGQAGGDISKVQWSAFDDHTGWTAGVDQSGFQLMNTGGSVMGFAGGEYGIILQRERIVRMTRTGDSTAPFQFDEISSNFGCASGDTIAQAGRSIFFLSDRGFMALDDGQVLKPIGSEKVDRTFDNIVSRDDYTRIHTAVDPQNKLVLWLVPGTPATIWVYNFELDRWSTIVVTAHGIFPGFTTSVGLEDLAVTYPDLDAMTPSLDDPRFQGGNPRLYLIDTANKLGTFSGSPLAAAVDMGFSELVPGQRARVRFVRPIWDGTSGMTLVCNAKARLGDAESLTSESNLRTTGRIPIRTSGRHISTSVRVDAATDWGYIQALEFECRPGGER